MSIVVVDGTCRIIRMRQARECPARVSGSDLFNRDFAALARACGWYGGFAAATAAAVSALERCIEMIESLGRPALLRPKLSADVITSRTTLSASREAALKSA